MKIKKFIFSFLLVILFFSAVELLVSNTDNNEKWAIVDVVRAESNVEDHTIIYGPFMAYSSIDQRDRPVKYVRVKAVTPDGDVFVKRTDVEGFAIFEEMPFEEFPNGTNFSARAFTYTDPAWEYGEDIPMLENDHWEFVTFSSIIYITPLIIFIFLFLLSHIRSRARK